MLPPEEEVESVDVTQPPLAFLYFFRCFSVFGFFVEDVEPELRNDSTTSIDVEVGGTAGPGFCLLMDVEYFGSGFSFPFPLVDDDV